MDPTRLTLGEWYGGHFVRLFHADARPGTLAQYRNTLAVWRRLTGDPPVAAIDPLTLADFRARCPGRPATVAKHCRHLNHLFAKLGPRGPRNRDALALLPESPWLKAPRSDHRQPLIPTADALDQFVALAPLDLALFAVVAATTGSRQTAIRELTLASVNAAGQLLRFPAHTDKRRRERVKPIPAATLAWLRQHADHMPRWKIQASSFNRRWKRHAARCGVPALRPHALKRWWAAQLIRAHATPWCVRYALDHAQNDVTGRFYIDPFDELAGLVDAVPLPASFAGRLRNQAQQLLPW